MKYLFYPTKKNFCFLTLSLTAIILILILSVSCNQQRPPIKIGLAINLSGSSGEAEEHVRNGALLAVKEINNAGGINGRPIRLLIKDDGNTEKGVKKAVKSLLAEEVVAIIGHSTSTTTLISYPIVTASNTLLFSQSASTDQLTDKDDLFIRTAVNSKLYGKKAAQLLQDKSIASVSILIDMSNHNFTEDWASSLKKHYHGHIDEIRFMPGSKESNNWSEIINRLILPEPEAIILLSDANITGMALQKLKNAGYAGLRITTGWALTPEIFRSASRAIEGLSFVTSFDPVNTCPAYLEFSDNMRNNFGIEGNLRSARAYEIIFILADALKRCQNIDSYELKKSLLSGEYETILGNIKFNQYGDVTRPIYEMVISNDKFYNNGKI